MKIRAGGPARATADQDFLECHPLVGQGGRFLRHSRSPPSGYCGRLEGTRDRGFFPDTQAADPDRRGLDR